MFLGYSIPRVSLSLSTIICISVMIAVFADNAWSTMEGKVPETKRTELGQRQDMEKSFKFDIGKDAIGRALLEFGEQAGLSVVVRHDVVEEESNELIGRYTIGEGLKLLLDGTGVAYRVTDDGIVVFREIAKFEPKSNGSRKPSLLGQLVAAIVMSFSGHAASAEDVGGQQFDTNTIEEVVVTATKRQANLQDVPLAISALTTSDLENRGVENFTDFARMLPGVHLSEGSKGFSKFTIRGLQTSTTYSGSGEQKPVAVYVDDVPVTSFAIVTPDIRLYDIERVEVLRGPQGTLFGAGSLGGAVRIITNKADPSNFDFSSDVELGFTDGGSIRQRYNVMANVPLVEDHGALRLVGYYRDEEGYLDNILTHVNNANTSVDWGGRGSLRWLADSGLEATFNLMYENENPQETSLLNPALGIRKVSSFVPFYLESTLTTFNATFKYPFESFELESSTSYSESDASYDVPLDNILAAVMPFAFGQNLDHKALVQELRLVSDIDSKFGWIVGGFFMERKTDREEAQFTSSDFLDSLNISGLPQCWDTAGTTCLTNTFSNVKDREQAIFGEVSYELSDTITLTGGLRYSGVKFDQAFTAEGFDSLGAAIGAIFGGGNATVPLYPVEAAAISTGLKHALTKKLSLAWRPRDSHMYYLEAAQGFRRDHPNRNYLVNGGKSTVDSTDPLIIPKSADSDSLWNYEVGAKDTWLNGQLRTNVAAFYMVWKDLQLPLTRPSDGFTFVGNAGKAISKGIEIEITAVPNASTDIGLNVTLQRAKIVSLSQSEADLSGGVEGARLTAPEFQLAAYAQYTVPLNNGSRLFGRVDVQHIDSYPNALPNTPGTGVPNPFFAKTDSYENVNVRIGWEDSHWSLIMFAENALNNDDYVYINPASYSLNRFGILRPRTVGLKAGWLF